MSGVHTTIPKPSFCSGLSVLLIHEHFTIAFCHTSTCISEQVVWNKFSTRPCLVHFQGMLYRSCRVSCKLHAVVVAHMTTEQTAAATFITRNIAHAVYVDEPLNMFSYWLILI